jgi:uncharacterized protein
MSAYWASLGGGMLIGAAAALLLLANGRVAGVSGIVAGLMRPSGEQRWLDLLFVIGLLAGPLLYRIGSGAWPVFRPQGSIPVFVVAGALVGFGSRLGSGCTSGHGVCGLARLSPRSFAAVASFLAAGIATVTVMEAWAR